MWTDPGNIQIAHRHINVEIGTDSAQFPVKKYINAIFVAVRCVLLSGENKPNSLPSSVEKSNCKHLFLVGTELGRLVPVAQALLQAAHHEQALRLQHKSTIQDI
jgi:hypothetical protein